MLRLKTATGWWLVTHPDHARLAGAFAEQWGNQRFLSPEPRRNVLRGIRRHDDGWATRDRNPQITRQGKPSAFSVELVGKYSAFEEIDLADYLAVRDRAVRQIASEDAYAALLISMHTYNLLTEHADRATIAPADLPLLDSFLEQQRDFQQSLRSQISADSRFTARQGSEAVRDGRETGNSLTVQQRDKDRDGSGESPLGVPGPPRNLRRAEARDAAGALVSKSPRK